MTSCWVPVIQSAKGVAGEGDVFFSPADCYVFDCFCRMAKNVPSGND